MPKRTKEQLQQIHEDLLLVKEVVNQLHELGELWPTPLNGKTWQQEKDEHYFAGINAITNLLRSGKIKSCEVISTCELSIRNLEIKRIRSGFWNHYGTRYPSSKYGTVNNGRTSIDEIIDEVELALQERLPETRLTQLENDIDSFGNTACGPRAMLENIGKSSGLNSNLSLPKVNSINCHFKA